MKENRCRKFMKLLCSALLLLGISAAFPATAANANYFDDLYNGLQKFSELPSDVNQLQESYRQTAEELQQTQDELGNTQAQLGETLKEMDTYRTQNAALQEQNLQLTKVVDELRDDRVARESYLHKIKITVITGIALVLGYFILIRLLRFGMRHRSRRGDRLR